MEFFPLACRIFAENQFTFPKNERAMLFKGWRCNQNSLVLKKRRIPFDRLRHVRTRGMNEFADALQNRFRETGRLGDVSVNA